MVSQVKLFTLLTTAFYLNCTYGNDVYLKLNYETSNGWAIWNINKTTFVEVGTYCYLEEEFWPKTTCTGGIFIRVDDSYLSSNFDIDKYMANPDGYYARPKVTLKSGNTTIDARYSKNDDGYNRLKALALVNVAKTPEENGFQELLDSKSPIVSIDDKKVWLAGFHEYAEDSLNKSRVIAQAETNRERFLIIIKMLASLGGVIIGWLAVRRFAYFLRKNIPMLAQRATRSWIEWRVRSIALSETVRASTQEIVKKANIEETKILRQQIKNAINKDDAETAKGLLLILERLENEPQLSERQKS